jgi:hypothetical protein
LEQYQQVSQGMVRVIRRDPLNESEAEAVAAEEGVKPWLLDGGGVCYLGLAVVQNARSASLPRLTPEWEFALEPDVTRAIVSVTRASATVPQRQTEARAEDTANALQTVEERIPNLSTVSLEEGTKILREASLQEFIAAVNATQPEIDAVEQRMRSMEGQMSEDQRQAFLSQIQQLQATQKQELGKITSALEAQIEALKALKGIQPNPTVPREPRSPTRPTR